MKQLLKVLFEKFCNIFRKKGWLSSTEQTHWVNHICDETAVWPNSAGMYANVHGFEEGSEGNWTYWLGIDIRAFFIRSADYVLKFKSKSVYEEYKSQALNDMTKILSMMRSDGRLVCRRGDDVNVEFIFRWGDDDKSFDVHLAVDDYAEQK